MDQILFLGSFFSCPFVKIRSSCVENQACFLYRSTFPDSHIVRHSRGLCTIHICIYIKAKVVFLLWYKYHSLKYRIVLTLVSVCSCGLIDRKRESIEFEVWPFSLSLSFCFSIQFFPILSAESVLAWRDSNVLPNFQGSEGLLWQQNKRIA